MDRDVEGVGTATYLWEQKRVVPFLKIPEDGEPYLEGLKCSDCGAIFLGERTTCAKCGTRDKLAPVKLSNQGELYVYSIVHRSFPGVEVPYISAVVDLDGGAPIRDAVVVIDPGPPTRASQGNTAELPALTGRTLYTERVTHYIVSPYSEAPQRVVIAQALARGAALSREQEEALAALSRPVYVLVESAARSAARKRWGEPIVAAEPLALYRWHPSETRLDPTEDLFRRF